MLSFVWEVQKMKNTTLGSYIRSLRTQNGMTQAQLGDIVGITDKAVSKWERDLSYPDIAMFPKLADTLGVTVDDMLNKCTVNGQPSRLLQIFGMTHDIRTPLHIILGCVNMAKLHRDDPVQVERYLESIRIFGEYLLKIVNRLMQVTYQDPQASELDAAAQEEYPANIAELGEYLNRRLEAREGALHSYDFSGKRILVADDILMNREIAAELLKQTGAQVQFAEDGRVCLELVKAAPAGYYDLILMDIMMPNMDGLEATRQIRQLSDPVKAALPVIAVSANVYEEERRAAREAGMDDFVEKPIFIDRLFETMQQYLGIE